MTPARNLSKTQLQLIERLRVSPVLSTALIPEYAGSKNSLKVQIHFIRKHGINVQTKMPEVIGRGHRDACEYFLA